MREAKGLHFLQEKEKNGRGMDEGCRGGGLGGIICVHMCVCGGGGVLEGVRG